MRDLIDMIDCSALFGHPVYLYNVYACVKFFFSLKRPNDMMSYFAEKEKEKDLSQIIILSQIKVSSPLRKSMN